MHSSYHRRYLALLVLLIVVAGCGMGLGTVPVHGTVKLDGQPLAKATVQYLALDPGGKDALGTTDANGMFRLSTLEPGDGAFPGKYKVVVRSVSEADPNVVSTTVLEAMQAASSSRKRAGGSVIIPPRFSNPGKTILEQNVPSHGDVVFELQSE